MRNPCHITTKFYLLQFILYIIIQSTPAPFCQIPRGEYFTKPHKLLPKGLFQLQKVLPKKGQKLSPKRVG